MPKWKPLLAAVLVLAPLAAAQTKPSDRNAALKYWPAWSVLQAPSAAADPTQPDTESAAIGMLIEASRLTRCDFEVESEKGVETLLYHLAPARSAARALASAADVKLKAGDVNAAAERVATAYRMAEHMTHDNILISSLVSIAITTNANTQARAILASGKLTPAGRDAILGAMSRLSGKDPFHTRAAIAGEKNLTIPWIKQFKGPGAGNELATKINSGVEADQPQVTALQRLSGAEIARLTDGLSKYYDDAIAAWDDEDAVNKLGALGKDVEKNYGLIAGVLGPALGRARTSDLKAQAELAETLAAVKAAK